MKNRLRILLTLAVLLCGFITPAWAQPTDFGTPLITSADQLSSPFSDTEEGKYLGALCDFDANTFWHSDWHNVTEEGQLHWLQMELPEEMEGDMVLWIKRRNTSEDHPTKAILTGSLTADFKEEIPITTVELGNAVSGQEFTTEPWNIPSSVKYIRFTPIDCKGDLHSFRTY